MRDLPCVVKMANIPRVPLTPALRANLGANGELLGGVVIAALMSSTSATHKSDSIIHV